MRASRSVFGLCARNSARSQMGETLLREHAVCHLISVCERIERERPRLFPGAARQDSWPIPEPVAIEGTLEALLPAFREVRDDLERRTFESRCGPEVGLIGVRV